MNRYALLAASLLLAGAANAQISLTFSSSTLFAVPNTTVTFQGTIVNSSTTDTIFLNGLAGSFDSANLNINGSSYLGYVPVSLAPNTSYTGNLFDVIVASITTPGAYNGSVQLLGGTTDTAQNPLTALQGILVGVSVPEPGSLGLLALGGLGTLALRRRSRR
jgi:hypothetical protein